MSFPLTTGWDNAESPSPESVVAAVRVKVGVSHAFFGRTRDGRKGKNDPLSDRKT